MVDINEFKSYFQRDSEGQQDEPDDVEVKFIDDGASPQGINLQVSKHLSAFSGLTSCFDADEFPHSPEVHPFDRINTTLADQSESNKSSRTAMMKKMNNQSFYSVRRGVPRARFLIGAFDRARPSAARSEWSRPVATRRPI